MSEELAIGKFIPMENLKSFIYEVCKIMKYNSDHIEVNEINGEYKVIFPDGCEAGKNVLAEMLRKVRA